MTIIIVGLAIILALSTALAVRGLLLARRTVVTLRDALAMANDLTLRTAIEVAALRGESARLSGSLATALRANEAAALDLVEAARRRAEAETALTSAKAEIVALAGAEAARIDAEAHARTVAEAEQARKAERRIAIGRMVEAAMREAWTAVGFNIDDFRASVDLTRNSKMHEFLGEVGRRLGIDHGLRTAEDVARHLIEEMER